MNFLNKRIFLHTEYQELIKEKKLLTNTWKSRKRQANESQHRIMCSNAVAFTLLWFKHRIRLCVVVGKRIISKRWLPWRSAGVFYLALMLVCLYCRPFPEVTQKAILKNAGTCIDGRFSNRELVITYKMI